MTESKVYTIYSNIDEENKFCTVDFKDSFFDSISVFILQNIKRVCSYIGEELLDVHFLKGYPIQVQLTFVKINKHNGYVQSIETYIRHKKTKKVIHKKKNFETSVNYREISNIVGMLFVENAMEYMGE